MKLTSFFSSVLYLFAIVLLFALGLLFYSLRWLDILSYRLAEALLYRPESFVSLGIIFISLSIFLLLAFYSIFRYKYISIKSTPFPCEVDLKIIKKYAEKYFEGLFDMDSVGTEVSVFRNKIEIIAYLPSDKEIESSLFLEKASEDFSKLMKEKFSYTKKILITFKQG